MTGKEYIQWRIDTGDRFLVNLHEDSRDLLACILDQYAALRIHDVGGSVYRYPMTYNQPCQIDCRVTSCKFYQGDGVCNNISPAITLNEDGKFVCWSKTDR